MLAETIQRLKDAAPVLKHVAGAAELAAVKTAPPLHLLPAAYVVPLSDRPAANELIGGFSQDMTSTVGVVLAVAGAHADPTGAAAALDLTAVRRSVWHALLAWPPLPEGGPYQLAGGDLLRFADGVLWWQDSFSAVRPIEP